MALQIKVYLGEGGGCGEYNSTPIDINLKR